MSLTTLSKWDEETDSSTMTNSTFKLVMTMTTLDNAVRIRDQMQVVYKEVTRDGAKFNVAKWNLIDGIQFEHVKNCLMFM